MSTGWEEKDSVDRCVVRDPEGLQCVLANGHAGVHLLESGSSYSLRVPHDGEVTLQTHIEAAPASSIEESGGSGSKEPDRGSRRRGCGLFAGTVAVVVASALIQRRR
jgi:hypothetical protein